MHDWSDQRARRRHQLNPSYTGVYNSNNQNNSEANQLAATTDNHAAGDKNHSQQRGFSGFLPTSDSFTGISQYTTQFWNSAQTFADQFQRDPTPTLESEPREDEEPDPFQAIDMPYRDRTNEFKTVCKSYEMKILANGKVHNRDERNKLVQSSIEFNQRAKRIGRMLSITCAKMEKLTELAKKKSLFDDPALEIEKLSREVQEDITGLNNQIGELSHLLQLRYSNAQGAEHSRNVVVGLQRKLATVGTDFKKVLNIRTENLKAKKNNRDRYCQAEPVPSSMPQSGSNVLLADDAASLRERHGGNTVLEMDQLQVQSPLLDNTDTYHRDRLGAMENIESSISQLGQIFSQLAHLVQEQGEMITRIDSNVEHTSINIEGAHHELLRYFNNISRNRWLIIKVFGVLIAFIVFFIVFLA